MSTARCSRCRRAITWARVDGELVPLDGNPLEPAAGLVAFNPRRATGRELLDEHVDGDGAPVWAWAYSGATFHARHAETCTATRHTGQGALAL